MVIGSNGKLPWKCPTDLKYFSKLTSGHTVVMGRKTFESIGKPLKNRTNIVISSTFPFRNVEMASADLIWLPGLTGYLDGREGEAFIIGGESIYRQTIDSAERIYLTRILADVAGDAIFPSIDPAIWHPDDENPPIVKTDNDEYPMQFFVYRKR